MLSQIEHGTARPSMSTLKILAARLGKPVSYFLEESSAVTPNQALMEDARSAFDRGDFPAVRDILQRFQLPDPIFAREFRLISALTALSLAETALEQSKTLYARQLLEEIGEIPYVQQDVNRRIALLEAKLSGRCAAFPSLDEELLLRAKDAFAKKDFSRSLHLLEAMEDRTGPQWHLLRGKLHIQEKNWQQAAGCFHRAETPETYPLLELCYREMEDFKQAYYYACKQKT
jgi:transcriptional regulator with XRE-family HTH domain